MSRNPRLLLRRSREPVVLVLILLATEACGDRSGAADNLETRATAREVGTLPPAPAAAQASALPPDVPLYPGAREATDLRRSMERAWKEAGEPEDLFDDRLGEVILWTDDPWEEVRAFYRPRAARILMDHEMEFPGVGRQKMLTGLLQSSDGSIVKFTATRPFFRYPDQARVDHTVIQIGRLGTATAPLEDSHPTHHPAENRSHSH